MERTSGEGLKPVHAIVYRLGSLGDTVVALPEFHAVRRAFPEARITLLTNRTVSAKAAAEVFRHGEFFERVLDHSEEKPVSA
jgi:heptosyltransferase-3